MNPDVDPAISSSRKLLPSDKFADYDALQEYVSRKARNTNEERSKETNLTLLWTILLLAIGSENNVKYLWDGDVTKSELVYHGRMLIEELRPEIVNAAASTIDEQKDLYSDEVNQAYCCVCLLIKHHALARGINPRTLTPMGSSLLVRPLDAKKLPTGAAYIASSSNLLTTLCEVVQPSSLDRRVRVMIAESVLGLFDAHATLYDGYMEDISVATQFHRFLELALTPYNGVDEPAVPLSTLDWALHLTTDLLDDAKATAAAPRYNPLEMANWSVAAFTFCDMRVSITNKGISACADERLGELRAALKKKSDSFHKNFGFEWFFGGKMVHWTDAVLAMIDDVMGKPSAVETGRGADDVFVSEYTKLVGKGWLNSIMYFNQ